MQEQKFYNLTNPQKSIWVTEEYFKGTAINNICGTALINEKVNLRLLEKSILLVLNNNDIFRIKFCVENGEVKQFVSNYINSDIIYLNAKNIKELNNLKNEIVAKPFHLLNSHPYNFYIIKFPNGHAAFSLNIHHILADSWTLGFLSKQVVKTYCALLQLDEPYFCETYSYIDYINSEKKYKTTKRFLKDKNYWNNEFETIPDLPFIPGSKNFSADSKDIQAKRAKYSLNKKLVDNIKKYCKQNKVSLYNFFMAIYSLYIGGITDLDEFVIGTPILNRKNYKEKNTAGLFINIAALRINLKNSLTFKDLVKNISKKSIEMLKHQKYSYQSLIEDLTKSKRNIPNLYNLVFSYQITNTQSKEIFVDYSTDWTFNGNSKENLSIQVLDLDNTGALTVCYDYKTSIYTYEDINLTHKRVLNIINTIISKENIELANLEFVTPKEKMLILDKYNDIKLEYDKTKTISELNEKLEQAYMETIQTMRYTVEAKDTYTRGHSDRVSEYSVLIGKHLNLPEEDIRKLRIGGLFHDIGKIGVPDNILQKNGKLSDDEYSKIKNHPTIGVHILSNATMFKNILPIVKHHHERYDGKGYPDQLKGEDIPYLARIAAVADSFDAMTSRRVYRDSLPINVVTKEFEKNRGIQFDPEISNVFLDILKNDYDKIKEIQEKYIK